MKLTLTTILATLYMMPNAQADDACIITDFLLWVVVPDQGAWPNKLPGGDETWVMTDGDIICNGDSPQFNIEAYDSNKWRTWEACADTKVSFNLEGPFNHARTESRHPFFAFGNSGDDYGNYGNDNVWGQDTVIGDYTLTATQEGQAPLTISFSIIDCYKCYERDILYGL